MSRTVQNVKNSLKFKAAPKAGLLSIKVGVKKFSVPVDVRLLSDGKYLFLSFPAVSELYSVAGKSIAPLPAEADASAAYESLTPTAKRRGRKRGSAVSLPAELEAALKSLPSGFKLGYGTDGSPKLVRTRTRRRKGA